MDERSSGTKNSLRYLVPGPLAVALQGLAR